MHNDYAASTSHSGSTQGTGTTGTYLSPATMVASSITTQVKNALESLSFELDFTNIPETTNFGSSLRVCRAILKNQANLPAKTLSPRFITDCLNIANLSNSNTLKVTQTPTKLRLEDSHGHVEIDLNKLPVISRLLSQTQINNISNKLGTQITVPTQIETTSTKYSKSNIVGILATQAAASYIPYLATFTTRPSLLQDLPEPLRPGDYHTYTTQGLLGIQTEADRLLLTLQQPLLSKTNINFSENTGNVTISGYNKTLTVRSTITALQDAINKTPPETFKNYTSKNKEELTKLGIKLPNQQIPMTQGKVKPRELLQF